MKFSTSALLLILSAAITQSAVTPAQSDCQIVQKAYKTAGGEGFNDCSQAEEFGITISDDKVTKM